ncbi:MAG: aldose 1-epimerase [Planctomycetales bacterium]|nr:aldose 1-epimerase [Planctomycetales bacterium]
MVVENIVLRDAAGSVAEIAPALGFNCHRFAVPHKTALVEVLWREPSFLEGVGKPSRSGVPVLFPFPGRLPGQALAWQGKTYQLGSDDGRGNAIHGFVHARPWRVISQSASRVVGEFHAWRDDPALRTRWPADFRITATYELAGSSLKMHYVMENPGETGLPCGLGTHPYFRVPLGGNSANDCLVQLPVTTQWELIEMIPTGRQLPLDNSAELATGRKFGELTLDNCFAGLQFSGPWCAARLLDKESGLTMSIRFDRAFRECVVYTPPHREAICIEPYTCVPGAAAMGDPAAAGLRILNPGESFEANVEFAIL